MARRARRRRPVLLALTAGALLALSGCATIDRSIELSTAAVLPVTVGNAAAISADDLAESMLRAGFSRDQILRDGPALRNALATSGGAQVRTGRVVEAMFAIHGNRLYVTSRMRGTFVQPLREPDFHLQPAAAGPA